MLAGTGIATMLTAGFLLGSLTVGPVFAQTPPTTPPAQTQVDEQQPQYTGSIKVNDAQYEGMSEADEAAALQSKATISAANAEAAAVAANPGASVVKTELDNENGVLVYSVELSNGKDVKVDAGTAKVLHTEAGGLDRGGEVHEQKTVEG
ncbi:MAG: PepSY domain-containing protein [Chloroflexi bacterium]|nr:PepSY domain-containing protein [Chloroflexota bacterium]MCL5074886.1 PepSY domain-containing protein [Chloroflexota bacterium]